MSAGSAPSSPHRARPFSEYEQQHTGGDDASSLSSPSSPERLLAHPSSPVLSAASGERRAPPTRRVAPVSRKPAPSRGQGAVRTTSEPRLSSMQLRSSANITEDDSNNDGNTNDGNNDNSNDGDDQESESSSSSSSSLRPTSVGQHPTLNLAQQTVGVFDGSSPSSPIRGSRNAGDQSGAADGSSSGTGRTPRGVHQAPGSPNVFTSQRGQMALISMKEAQKKIFSAASSSDNSYQMPLRPLQRRLSFLPVKQNILNLSQTTSISSFEEQV